jgi:toxin YhaV
MSNSPFDIRHGWKLHMYSAFKEPYDALVADVGALKTADPNGYEKHPKAKLLKRINELILDEIPANPGNKAFRQGNTLGDKYKDWFRAKFLNRFRLFFRYNTKAEVIIYCWVNDENTLRKSGSDSDPYKVFAKMLKNGTPPADWDDLKKTVVG